LDAHAFQQASLVVSSSLTRALQTALVVLRDHPAVVKGGIVVRPECRELKNTLGLDTVSAFKGDAIATRAKVGVGPIKKPPSPHRQHAPIGVRFASSTDSFRERLVLCMRVHSQGAVYVWRAAIFNFLLFLSLKTLRCVV
jgi:broad specificity phosphatase PhoE